MSTSSPSKEKLIIRSLLIAGGLTLFKTGVFLVTNSVSILASAVDSLLDLLVSLMNFIFIRTAAAPPDQNHPYGHGKIESLAGLIQSLLIGVVTVGVGISALRRFAKPQDVREPMAGIVVMVVALLFNLWHVRNLKRSMKATESQVMATEYLHFVSDTFVYVGVLLSFVLIHVTGYLYWDSLVSLLIVVYLIKSVISVVGNSLAELLDMQLPDEVLAQIDQTIRNYNPHVIDYHDLRTRKVGLTKFIEFHVVVRGVEKFVEAHDLTEGLIRKLRKMYPGAVVTVHTDPDGVMEDDGE